MTTVLQAQLGFGMPSQQTQSSSLSRLSHSDYYDDEDELEPDGLVRYTHNNQPQQQAHTDDPPQEGDQEMDEEIEEDEDEDEEVDVLADDESVVLSGGSLLEDEDEPQKSESSEDEMARKPQAEQDAIRYEMQQLLDTIPQLGDQYSLVDRLGEGQQLC